MSDVITFLSGISDAAKTATKSLELLATTGQAAASSSGGSDSGITTGGSGGPAMLGTSASGAGSMDAGKLLAAMKSLGGRA